MPKIMFEASGTLLTLYSERFFVAITVNGD
jgi:hypothetical protein